MNFYEWMIGKYYGKDTPRGDLAGDMKHEEAGFPKDGDRQRILDYLDGMFACDECIALFKITVTPDDERAWFRKHPQWSKSNRYAELEVWIFI